MIQLLIGILLAALSGLTFVAYRHPKEYQKLVGILMYVCMMAFGAASIYNGLTIFANSATLEYVVTEIPDTPILQFEDRILETASALRTLARGFVLFLAAMAYLQLLVSLPKIGITHEASEPSGDSDGT